MAKPPFADPPQKAPFTQPLYPPLGRDAFSPLTEAYAAQAFQLPIQQAVWYELDALPGDVRPYLGGTFKTSGSERPQPNVRAAKRLLGPGYSGRMEMYAKYGWDPIETWSEAMSIWLGYDRGEPVAPMVVRHTPETEDRAAENILIGPSPAPGYQTWLSLARVPPMPRFEPVSSASALIHCLAAGKKDNNLTNMLMQPASGAVASLDASQQTLQHNYMPDSLGYILDIKDDPNDGPAFLAAAAEALQRAETYPTDRLFAIGTYMARRMNFGDGQMYSVRSLMQGMDKQRLHLRETLAQNGLVLKP